MARCGSLCTIESGHDGNGCTWTDPRHRENFAGHNCNHKRLLDILPMQDPVIYTPVHVKTRGYITLLSAN